MPPVGFEPTVSAGEQPQTNALDRAATGITGIYRITAALANLCLVSQCLVFGRDTGVEPFNDIVYSYIKYLRVTAREVD